MQQFMPKLETAAVDEVSFGLRSGEITGYLGSNGSGKSTTVKMLTGLVEPSSGEILFDGKDVRCDLQGFKRPAHGTLGGR